MCVPWSALVGSCGAGVVLTLPLADAPALRDLNKSQRNGGGMPRGTIKLLLRRFAEVCVRARARAFPSALASAVVVATNPFRWRFDH